MSKLDIVIPRGMFGRMADDSAVEGLIRDLALYYASNPFDSCDDPQKYGILWNDDRFWMRYDCQCGNDDCWFCAFNCGCEGECRYFIDGVEVDPETYWKRNKEFLGKLPHEVARYGSIKYKAYSREWDARVKERDRRWLTLYPAVTHTCFWREILENRPEGPDCRPRQDPAHFCLKRTGLKVWWYKFIGRDMEYNRPPTLDDLRAIAELMDNARMTALKAEDAERQEQSALWWKEQGIEFFRDLIEFFRDLAQFPHSK